MRRCMTAPPDSCPRARSSIGATRRRELGRLSLRACAKTGEKPAEIGTSNACRERMNAKPPTRERDADAACPPARISSVLVSSSTPEPERAAELIAGEPSRHPPAKPDRILAIFDWLCAGPVSQWERELTRHARWRLA